MYCKYYITFLSVFIIGASIVPPSYAAEPAAASVADLRREIDLLRQQLADQRAFFEGELRRIESRMRQVTVRGEAVKPEPAADDLEATLNRMTISEVPSSPAAADLGSRIASGIQSLNPDISVIVDTFYHNDSADEPISHLFEEIAGFGHSHGDDDHGHEHAHLEEGFNLRHLELHLSADVDPYFKAWAIAAVSEHSAELEEAVIQTLALPGGLQLKAGKFFSDFGRLNAQHAHAGDVVDRPLVHRLLFGDHGLNEKGVQLSWLAPTPFQLLAGVEAFQGDNELVAQHHGDAPLRNREGPRLWVGWLKLGPNLPPKHGLQFGVFAGRGVHQEEHDALDNRAWQGDPCCPGLYPGGDVVPTADGHTDHWLDGDTRFWGADIVYKYDAPREHGHGDLTLQAEYIQRKKDLELVDHLLPMAPVGNDRIDRQDGYYVQAVYGIWPRWRVGARWEQVGLTNETEFPDGSRESFGDSHRVSGMVDFTPSHFSRLRLQLGRGTYELEDGDEDVWQVFVQWMVSLGSHGAHKF